MNILVSICVVLALASTAFADFRAGVDAYQRGNHMMAFQEFWTLAQEGHAGAQFNLGVMYANGLAVPQDFGQAARCYRLAAERGHALAQCNLGVLYEAGKGVTQNDGEAIHWYRLAAEQGNSGGQNNLGRMYEEGRGVPRDASEALDWYQKAAAQGNAQAQANLARLSATTSVPRYNSGPPVTRAVLGSLQVSPKDLLAPACGGPSVLIAMALAKSPVLHWSSRTSLTDSAMSTSRHFKESFPDSDVSAFVVRMLLTTQQSPLGRSMSKENDGD